MPEPKAFPTVGRIVHVRRPGSDVCQAGIVTDDADDMGAIIVAVFSRLGPFGPESRHIPNVDWVAAVAADSPKAPLSPGTPTWHWPERTV